MMAEDPTLFAFTARPICTLDSPYRLTLEDSYCAYQHLFIRDDASLLAAKVVTDNATALHPPS